MSTPGPIRLCRRPSGRRHQAWSHAVGRKLLLCVLGAGLPGCAAAPPDAAPAEGRQRAALEFTSAEDVEFGFVADLDVDSRGRIYVGDLLGSVVVLDGQGRLERRIGSRGSGPGEFESVRNVQVVEGDSLLVFDPYLSRMTFYAPGAREPAYTAGLTSAGMRPHTLRRLPGDRRMLAFFRAVFQDGDGRGPASGRSEVVRVLNGDGSLHRDSVLTPPETEVLLHYRAGELWGVFRYDQARKNLMQMGRDGRVYSLWTGADSVHVADPDGRTVRVIRPRETRTPRPVVRGEIDALITRLAGDHVPEVEVREMVERKGITAWPLVTGFVLDDDDRVWIGYTPLAQGGEVEWIGYDRDGRAVGRFQLPANVTVHRFRGDRLYADVRDELDVQTVAVFRLLPEAA